MMKKAKIKLRIDQKPYVAVSRPNGFFVQESGLILCGPFLRAQARETARLLNAAFALGVSAVSGEVSRHLAAEQEVYLKHNPNRR